MWVTVSVTGSELAADVSSQSAYVVITVSLQSAYSALTARCIGGKKGWILKLLVEVEDIRIFGLNPVGH